MRRLASLVCLWSFVGTATTHAQTLVLSQNKCGMDKQEQIRRMADSLWMPIAQELVNEGKLTSVGSAYHAWGDEWNVIVWYIAPNMNAFNTGFNELVTRINQRHPALFPQFTAWCSEHKDSIYNMGRTTTAATGPRRE